MQKIEISGETYFIFREKPEEKNPDFLLVQMVDDNDLSRMEGELRYISEGLKKENRTFALAAVLAKDWNSNLTPWDAPAVFGSRDFGHGAGDTLGFILNTLLPDLYVRNVCRPAAPVILGGYSLAGFFALWAGCVTDRFQAVAAASPSVWYPGWISFSKNHVMQAKRVYLSLGDREEKTRNPVMASVGVCIRQQYEILQKQNISTVLEQNPGNHFRDSDSRTAKAFVWCMK